MTKLNLEIAIDDVIDPCELSGSDEIRATFIVNKQRLDNIKSIAFWDRRKIKEIHDEALKMYINSRKDLPEFVFTHSIEKKSENHGKINRGIKIKSVIKTKV